MDSVWIWAVVAFAIAMEVWAFRTAFKGEVMKGAAIGIIGMAAVFLVLLKPLFL